MEVRRGKTLLAFAHIVLGHSSKAICGAIFGVLGQSYVSEFLHGRPVNPQFPSSRIDETTIGTFRTPIASSETYVFSFWADIPDMLLCNLITPRRGISGHSSR
jgi:hypothetical protein